MPPIHSCVRDPGVAPAPGSPTQGSTEAHEFLDTVLATGLLSQRTAHDPDHAAENATFCALARCLAEQPQLVLHQVVEAAARLRGDGSAGVAILEYDDRPVLRWNATTGVFKAWHEQRVPLAGSLGAFAAGRRAVQLICAPADHDPIFAALPRPVHELLLVPLLQQEKCWGALWIATHDATQLFDAEDARVAITLSHFASAGWGLEQARTEIDQTRRLLEVRESEQARSRHELRETRAHARLVQARFEAFFDQSPIYAGILTPDGVVIEVGRMALEACGYRREDIIGKAFSDTGWWRDSPEQQQRVRDGVATARRGEAFNALLPYRFADGSEHLAEVRLSPIYDDQRVVRFLIAIGIDVTERIVAEQELKAARRRLDSALIAAELGVYEWDVVADRLYGDENCLRLFNLQPDEEGGASLSAYLNAIHPEDREKTARLVQDSVETGANFEVDYRVLRPDGERWINSRGRMTKDALGQVVSFFGVVLDITARKRAEAEREGIANELRRLAAIHETVLSATDDFAYIFDRDGRFLYANRRLLEVWARKLDDVVGRTCYQLGYPTWHADMHMREIAEVIATRQPIRGEVPFTGGSGISGIYDYIFAPVFGADGQVELIAGTTRDVTDRRRAEDRDRFLVALDDATRPLTEADKITRAYAQLLGDHLQVSRCAYADVERDENTFNLTGDYNRDVPSIVGRYRFDQFGVECLRLMRAGESYIVEDAAIDPRTEAVRTSYETTGIRAVICVPLHKQGHFVAAMAVHHATPRVWQPAEIELVRLVANRCWESIERTRVMRALAENEQQLHLAVETARLGVWELDLPTEELKCSAQCRANYGRTAHQPFTYRDFWQAVHPDDRERIRIALQHSIATPTGLDLEFRAVWPDGTAHWILVRGHAVPGTDGRPVRLIGVSLDITERKQAERELARLHEEAVKASRAKDDFLAALSHELRTPLNPVLLLASDAANDLSLPSAAREAFAIVRKYVELEARLIDDLLDLTSIVRGKLPVQRQSVEIHSVLSEAATTMQAELTEKHITFVLQPAAPASFVEGDPVRLLQVFLNLLRNAVKFTPAGGAITVTTELAPSRTLTIQFSDTGIGLTRPELERAFDAFEQGEHATGRGSQRFGGLGLGLAIARQLVELHDGSISAVSKGRDQGAKFVVKLPLAARPAAADASPPLNRRPSPPPDGEPQAYRLLLVEDHEPTRGALHKLLLRRGYDVVYAGSLAEARARAEEQTFDLLVSDIGLPDGDGNDLMAELRDQFGLKGIALTGYGMARDVERSRAAGFITHLTKPVRIEALDAALAQALAATEAT